MQDEQIIRSLISDFFRGFVSQDVGAVHLANLKPLFIPQAIVIKTCGAEPIVYSFDEFIEPRQKILTDGTLREFSEREVSTKIDLFGDIAQSFVVYHKRGLLSGQPYEGYGIKSIQFVRFGDTWKIASILWDDERDGVVVSPQEKAQQT
jgi:hypothetical protein